MKDYRIPSTTTPISRFDYTVNGINQRTQVQTTGSAFPSEPADWAWGYDALGQVTSTDSPTAGFDRAYEYDLIGNRKKSADSLTLPETDNYTVNPLNQYDLAADREVNVHDADGNLERWANHADESGREGQKLYYDGENRLVRVERWHNDNETLLAKYVYDSQSRRIARIADSGVTLYLYDGWNCVAEYTLHNSSFILQTSNTWCLDLSGSLQGAGGVGGMLSVTKHQAQSTTHYFPTYDGNGNISEYLTASGSIVAHYEYDLFGRTTVESGTNAADFSYRFSTKPRDAATGLYYYGYRWFDPDTGRWINRDPLEESGGLNFYGFSGNNPISSIDYLGLLEPDLEGENVERENDLNGGSGPELEMYYDAARHWNGKSGTTAKVSFAKIDTSSVKPENFPAIAALIDRCKCNYRKGGKDFKVISTRKQDRANPDDPYRLSFVVDAQKQPEYYAILGDIVLKAYGQFECNSESEWRWRFKGNMRSFSDLFDFNLDIKRNPARNAATLLLYSGTGEGTPYFISIYGEKTLEGSGSVVNVGDFPGL